MYSYLKFKTLMITRKRNTNNKQIQGCVILEENMFLKTLSFSLQESMMHKTRRKVYQYHKEILKAKMLLFSTSANHRILLDLMPQHQDLYIQQ